MPVLPEDFNVKILPIKELEGVQAKKSSLAFEDLQALAANSDVGSITLKQLKNRMYSFGSGGNLMLIHIHTNIVQTHWCTVLQRGV
jgi:hypothetical protein